MKSYSSDVEHDYDRCELRPWEYISSTVKIPDGTRKIGNLAFHSCNFTSITIPSSVSSIGERSFYWCTELRSISIPDSVISIDKSAFIECRKLTSITLPSSLKTIEKYTFANCNFTSITIPSSVNYVGERAFDRCPPDLVLKVHKSNAHLFKDYKYEIIEEPTQNSKQIPSELRFALTDKFIKGFIKNKEFTCDELKKVHPNSLSDEKLSKKVVLLDEISKAQANLSELIKEFNKDI